MLENKRGFVFRVYKENEQEYAVLSFKAKADGQNVVVSIPKINLQDIGIYKDKIELDIVPDNNEDLWFIDLDE